LRVVKIAFFAFGVVVVVVEESGVGSFFWRRWGRRRDYANMTSPFTGRVSDVIYQEEEYDMCVRRVEALLPTWMFFGFAIPYEILQNLNPARRLLSLTFIRRLH